MLISILISIMLVITIVVIFYKIDSLDDRMVNLEYKSKRVLSELDLQIVGFPSNLTSQSHKTRLGRIQSEINFITHRLNNLPSEKAKVIQQKVDELEEMVKELK
jgi:hypothetical protein